MINKDQKDYIIKLLQENKELPEDFKYQLFPTKQKEYELAYAGKMRKEDILANEDGVFPVPLQVEKVFNGNEYEAFDDDWKNMIVFGDNLQFLKTIYENKDALIKDKVKGKVKLIYIDPPFATEEDFSGSDSQKAYTDKKKGAEFVEFLRKRLIIAKEILADDGSIFVHLDYKKAHYIKLVLDEIFGERNLVNEIIWAYTGPGSPKMKQFNRKHDTIFWYSKSQKWTFNKEDIRVPYKDPNQSFRSAFDSGEGWDEDDLDELRSKGKVPEDWWEFSVAARLRVDGVERTGYPTEKPNKFLERIIKATTNKGDIVLDFFGGSGATSFMSEKIGRKWITCDIGKLAYFTMQKRILQIQNSKDLEDLTKKYGKKAKSFLTASLGSYDLEKTFELERKKYLEFVSGLFEVNLKEYKVSGFSFEGKKDSYPVIIYDYNKYKDSSIDENYLQDLHRNIGKKVGSRVYIVAPINFVDFVDDFVEIDDVKYYFLKIPYHIINELHKKPFVKVRQPQSKSRVNDIEEAVGFHFKRPPEVKAEIKIEKDEIKIIIKSFKTTELQSDKTNEEKSYDNFETLSSVFIDKTYNGNSFEMDEAKFADELLPKKSKKKDDEENANLEDLKKLAQVEIPLKKSEIGEQIMIICTDIYGNDFTQTFKI
jgi:site-specific DNA-methyltransferase (adenine-specific)/adenine-specific DNA-methyltransferase